MDRMVADLPTDRLFALLVTILSGIVIQQQAAPHQPFRPHPIARLTVRICQSEVAA